MDRSCRNRSGDLGLAKICEGLGIPDVTFNTFRLTFALHFQRENDNLTLLQKVLGHRNEAQVNRYAKIVMNDRREALEKLSSPL